MSNIFTRLFARRVIGGASGIIIACGTAIVLLALTAQCIAIATPGDAAWAMGLVSLKLGFLPSLLIATIVGGALGWWRLGRPRAQPWSERPRDTVGGHYIVAWIAAVFVALLWWTFLFLVDAGALGSLSVFIGMLMPRMFRATAVFLIVFELVAMVTMGRIVLHRLDRVIHRRRVATMAPATS